MTEWEWFKAQLRLAALETLGREPRYTFNFDDATRDITCLISAAVLNQLRDADEGAQNDYKLRLSNWIEGGKELLRSVLARLPELHGQLSVDDDLTTHVLMGYGMGSIAICTNRGGRTEWAGTAHLKASNDEPLS